MFIVIEEGITIIIKRDHIAEFHIYIEILIMQTHRMREGRISGCQRRSRYRRSLKIGITNDIRHI
jgi:hypothetical protein